MSEAKEKATRPALAGGQLWERKGIVFIVHRYGKFGNPKYTLVCICNERSGDCWDVEGFGGHNDEFEYIGMANDLLTIKGRE